MLTVPSDVAALAGNTITIPIRLQTNGNEINSLIFSLDLDQAWLAIDADHLEDVISFDLPNGFILSPAFDASDADGELDFVIYHPTNPKAKLTDGDIILITIQTGSPVNPTLASILASQDPRASFANTSGQSIGGILVDGAVYISGSGLQQVYLPMTMFK